MKKNCPSNLSPPPDTDELKRLLRASRAHTDDLPRAVLADWLEERGDPRAEFVRIQAERAAIPAWDVRQSGLGRREAELLREHETRWLGRVATATTRHEFRRGMVFVEMVEGVRHDDSELVASPEWAWVEGVRFHRPTSTKAALQSPTCAAMSHVDVYYPGDRNWLEGLVQCSSLSETSSLCLQKGIPFSDDDATMLANCRFLGDLRCLELHGGPTGTGLVTLLSSPNLSRLRTLICETTDVSAFGLEPLARLDHPSLRELRLFGANLAAAGARILASSPIRERLHSLSLPVAHLGTQGLLALFAAPLTGLRHLDVTGRMTVGALKTLGQSKSLTNLRSLKLADCQMRLPAARALAAQPLLQQLETLDLQRNHLGCEGIAALAASPFLTGVRDLRLSHNHFFKQGAQALAESGIEGVGRLSVGSGLGGDGIRALIPWLNRQPLVHLDLRDSYPDAAALEALATKAKLRDLIELDLSGVISGFDERASKALASAPWLAGLVALSLFGSRLGADGLKWFLERDRFGPLRRLNLCLCALGDTGAKLLAKWPGLAGLGDLDLRMNGITNEGFQALAKSPHLRPGLLLRVNETPLSEQSLTRLRERLGNRVSTYGSEPWLPG